MLRKISSFPTQENKGTWSSSSTKVFPMAALILVCAVRTMQRAEAAKGAVKGEITKLVCGLTTEIRKSGPAARAHITKLQSEQANLADLSRKIRALARHQQGRLSIKESLLAGYVAVIHHRLNVAEKTASLATADLAETCGMPAGRLTEFLSVFAQAKGSATHCIAATGGGSARTADDIPCLTAPAFTDATEATGEATANTLATAYTAFKAALAAHGSGHSTNLCNLVSAQTSGNYLHTAATEAAVWWGGKFLQTAADGSDIAAASWAANGQEDITKSSFQKCHETLKTILAAGVDDMAASENLAKILTKNAPGIAELTITSGEIRKNVPSAATKITTADLTRLSNDIASLPKATGADQLTDTEQDAKDVQEILEINETACKLGKALTLQTTDKTESEDKTTKDKCSSKKGDECKGDCELVDGVCKPAKKGEGENQETGGKDGKTNTTGSNSFVINKAPLLLAVLLF